MEKFRLFTDKATGINPFTPVRGLDRISWPRFFIGILILVGTAPLILVIESLICLYESLFTLFAVLSLEPIVKTILGPIQWLMSRLYLVLLHHSFWSGSTSPFPKNPRKNILSASSSSPSSSLLSLDDAPNVKAGDVVVVNCQSPIDVLVVQRIFWTTPLLFAIAADKKDCNEHTPGIWWTAFRHTAMLRLLHASSTPSERIRSVDVRAIQRLGKRIGRPVVLFAEGTTSNGRSILQFPESLIVEGQLASGAVSLLGLTYHNSAAVNATIPQSSISFFVRVLGESVLSGGNGIDAVLSRPSVLVQLAHQDPENVVVTNPTREVAKVTDNSVVTEIRGDALQQALSETVSFERLSTQPCRCVSLSTCDKSKFYDMWVKHGNLV